MYFGNLVYNETNVKVTDLAGIGDVLGKRLAGKGFDRVRTDLIGHVDCFLKIFLL